MRYTSLIQCMIYVAPSSVLSVYYDKICLKFASHHFLLLLYAVYICQKNYWIVSTYSSTSKNVSWPHFSWPTLYTHWILCLNEWTDRCQGPYNTNGEHQIQWSTWPTLATHAEKTRQRSSTVWYNEPPPMTASMMTHDASISRVNSRTASLGSS